MPVFVCISAPYFFRFDQVVQVPILITCCAVDSASSISTAFSITVSNKLKYPTNVKAGMQEQLSFPTGTERPFFSSDPHVTFRIRSIKKEH
ncbi:hypothetical protein EG68_00162 [Paragonimus skrjabini miyazakii]|uniref:Uncharacterized protein n=1 Tax=Paragonimus skrjabini miyazakii TaxID=59628 RepID=A0A8S9ZCV1_9TREM|nr:hypothetical protein EG68_00162 [Paragonimus skrjabini miyazakii]